MHKEKKRCFVFGRPLKSKLRQNQETDCENQEDVKLEKKKKLRKTKQDKGLLPLLTVSGARCRQSIAVEQTNNQTDLGIKRTDL